MINRATERTTSSSRGLEVGNRTNPWDLPEQEHDHWHKSITPEQRKLIKSAMELNRSRSKCLHCSMNSLESGEQHLPETVLASRQHSLLKLTKSTQLPEVPSGRTLTPTLNESCTCPSCQQPLLDLNDGCGACGWLLGDTPTSPSKDGVRSNISPSNITPSKNRRRKGDGSGSIHWRTITRNGKDYPQAYYHWKENGRKRTKYIPKQLLGDIEEAEAQKLPIVEILELLGVGESPSNLLLGDIEISPSNPELPISPSNISPSKPRRRKGDGSGSIHWKTITRNGLDYPQPWYHYEVWEKGDRIIKKSKYIPKKLLGDIQNLQAEKAPIREILKLLGTVR